ncbi:MAG: 2-hydroxyacyl-CoA dehydratase subunit D [Bacillota bacterium]
MFKLFQNKSFVKKVLNTGLSYEITKLIARWKAEDFMKEAFLFNIEEAKKAYTSNKPTVWCSTFVPSELIYSIGGVPFMPEVAAGFVSTIGMAEEALQKAESDWLNNDLCSIHRCGTGLKLKGYMPEPDYIIASSHLCDGAKRYLQHISQEYDVPFYLLETSYYNYETKYLFKQIKELVDDIGIKPNFEKVFKRSNKAYKYHEKVNELRKQEPVVFSGERAMNLVPMEFMSFGSKKGIEYYKKLAKTLEKRITNGEGIIEKQKHRLLWLHLKPYYSQEIFTTLREKEAVIAFEEYNQLYWEQLDIDNPYYSLAKKMINHFGWRELEKQENKILKLIDEYNIDGVIGFSHWGCRQNNGRMGMLKKKLKDENNIPFLNIHGDLIDSRNYQKGQLRTRLQAFVELIEMKEREEIK